MTTSEKKPYHKSRHPWRDQDLRSEANKTAPRPAPPVMSTRDRIAAGVRTLLANHDGDPSRPLLSREENMNIAAVRVWLTKS